MILWILKLILLDSARKIKPLTCVLTLLPFIYCSGLKWGKFTKDGLHCAWEGGLAVRSRAGEGLQLGGVQPAQQWVSVVGTGQYWCVFVRYDLYWPVRINVSTIIVSEIKSMRCNALVEQLCWLSGLGRTCLYDWNPSMSQRRSFDNQWDVPGWDFSGQESR